MHIYSVYGEAKDSNNLQKIVIIKEGFSWPAFCFSIFWIVYSAHWLVSCGVLFSVILTVIYLKVDVIEMISSYLWFSIFLGIFANDMQRWFLEKKNFQLLDLIFCKNKDSALIKFLSRKQILVNY